VEENPISQPVTLDESVFRLKARNCAREPPELRTIEKRITDGHTVFMLDRHLSQSPKHLRSLLSIVRVVALERITRKPELSFVILVPLRE
jgi:hypothetical protein